MRKIFQIVLLSFFVKCSTSICVDQVCPTLCEYGYVVVDGCTTCECIDPCKGVICPPCQKCVATLNCLNCEILSPSVRCVCPRIICPQKCAYGYEYDSLGCQTCNCVNPCRNHRCGIDEYCHVQPVSCDTEYDYGYEATCLKNNPCQGVVCPAYHYCTVQTIYCLIPPCPPPFAVCKHYCEHQQLLIDDCGLAVQCSSRQKCPNDYNCTTPLSQKRSFCCSNIFRSE